jgi:hypothetical protein
MLWMYQIFVTENPRQLPSNLPSVLQMLRVVSNSSFSIYVNPDCGCVVLV